MGVTFEANSLEKMCDLMCDNKIPDEREDKDMTEHDVVQFTENHKWCGCFGVITEDRGHGHPRRYMIGVPIPDSGTAYIFDDGSSIELIGKAVLVEE